MKKRLLPLLLAVCLFITLLAPAAMAVEFSAKFAVSGDMPKLVAGQDGEIKFTLENVAIFAAYDVYMTLQSGGTAVLTTGSLVNRMELGTMLAEAKKDISIPVKVFKDAKTG